MAYEVFGRFYDDVMGDRAGPTKLLRNMIREACPDARTVLELACGTGSVLKHLQKDYAVAGLDSSRRMLSIARRKLPGVRLVRQDMTDFSMSRRFDVICCVYDSINHLTRFSDWQKVFARVRQHLLPDGCFIFDMNTKRKLDRHIAEPPWVHWFGKNLFIMDVRAVGTLGSNWNIVVFERLPDGRYARHEENIAEFAFPASKVVSALRREFARVRVIDTGRKRPSKRSEKLLSASSWRRELAKLTVPNLDCDATARLVLSQIGCGKGSTQSGGLSNGNVSPIRSRDMIWP